MDDALTGVRVLDLSDGVAGAFCTKLLATYGATVIKVEPPSGDPTRQTGPFPGDVPDPERSALFLYLNTDKQSITLDLTGGTGAAAFRRLALTADIVVESFTPGTLAALGLAYEELQALNRRLVLTSLTPFGQTGRYSDYQATHLINCASGGWMYTIGEPAREPLQSGGLMSEYAAGLHGTVGTLAAYFAAAAGGVGRRVDVSTQEALQIIAIYDTTRCSYTGEIPKRSGTHFPWMIAPCRDGLIACSILTDGQWEALCAWVQPEWLSDPRFATALGRRQHRDEIEAVLLEFFRQRGRDELFSEGQMWRIPVNPVPTVDELLQFDQHRVRDYFVAVEHPVAGALTYPGPPFKLSTTDHHRMRPAPLLGQDNDAILCRELGYRADEVAQLAGSAYVPPAPFQRVTPPSRQAVTKGRSLPLEGIRVLDLTWVMAGPVATSMLADLGAEVIKVEAIQVLDRWRGAATIGSTGVGVWEQSPNFNTLNRNKYGITLNLADPQGVALLRRLVAVSDIVAENFTPRVMQNFGMDYAKLKEIKPDLIMLSMPGFGLTGPWKDFVSFAFPTEEMAGITQLTGYRDGPPEIMGHGSCDALAGLNGAVALLLALEHHRRTGRGQHIDLSQMEACTSLIGEVILDYGMNGHVRGRQGNRHPMMAPHGVYRCSGEDQWVAIAIRSDAEWERFGQVLGSPEWVCDERFKTTAGRLLHHDELDARITAWTSTRRHLAVMQQLQAARIPASAVLHAGDLLMNPHLRARGFFEWVERAGDGGYWYPRQPIQLSDAAVGTRMPTPTLGENTDEVLQRLLALTTSELEALASSNVTGRLPLGLTAAGCVNGRWDASRGIAGVTDRRGTMAEEWQAGWQPMIDAIGTDFSDGAVRKGADDVERSGIRRFVEPLEFDCPLHHDEAVAKAHGYTGIVAPYSSVTSWTIPPMWTPGGAPVFTSAERDAQPQRSPVANMSARPTPAPPTTGYFATDIEIEYFQPVIVGDHLTSSGRRLLSVVPKETSVGRGAFLIWESEVRNQRGELVAKMRNGLYNYNPHAG